MGLGRKRGVQNLLLGARDAGTDHKLLEGEGVGAKGTSLALIKPLKADSSLEGPGHAPLGKC